MIRTLVSICVLVLTLFCVVSTVDAGEWRYRLYGYRPRSYGYPPSDYQYPRYGFQRGYVYYEGPPYGSPELGDPARFHAPINEDASLSVPIEEVEPAVEIKPSKSSQATPATVRKAARPKPSKSLIQ